MGQCVTPTVAGTGTHIRVNRSFKSNKIIRTTNHYCPNGAIVLTANALVVQRRMEFVILQGTMQTSHTHFGVYYPGLEPGILQTLIQETAEIKISIRNTFAKI